MSRSRLGEEPVLGDAERREEGELPDLAPRARTYPAAAACRSGMFRSRTALLARSTDVTERFSSLLT
jgi:hypothetical protein